MVSSKLLGATLSKQVEKDQFQVILFESVLFKTLGRFIQSLASLIFLNRTSNLFTIYKEENSIKQEIPQNARKDNY